MAGKGFIMKISVQTGGVTERGGIALAFRAIKAAGFDCVDLNIDQLQNLTWREMKTGVKSEIMSDENKIKEYIDEVKALKAETGLEITQAHSNMPSWLGDFPEANAGCLERIIKCIEISGAVGCPRLIVHPRFMGNINELLTKEEEWNLNIEFYTALIPHLKAHGVMCCLENMWAQDPVTKAIYSACCSDIDEACKYIDTLNEIAGEKLFGFCLDIGHLKLVGVEIYGAIVKLGDRLVALHIHDNDGLHDSHVMPYNGIIAWHRFVLGLREIGYKGDLSFETFGQLTNVPVDAIPVFLGAIRGVGEYFRNEIEK